MNILAHDTKVEICSTYLISLILHLVFDPPLVNTVRLHVHNFSVEAKK